MSKKIKRTPVPKDNRRSTVLRWRLMRNAEKGRKLQSRSFSRYKNDYLIELLSEAITQYYWTKYERKRIKILRRNLEENYNVPINFFCSFVYFATYKYMSWQHRSLNYKNYIGFISSENILVEFINYASSKPLLWRKKNSRWPVDFTEKWGIKTSLKIQKLGKRDKIIEEDIMSDKMQKRINRYL